MPHPFDSDVVPPADFDGLFRLWDDTTTPAAKAEPPISDQQKAS
jgi:hypothetical protein